MKLLYVFKERSTLTSILDQPAKGTMIPHRDDGKRFVVHSDEILTAFLELEAAIHLSAM